MPNSISLKGQNIIFNMVSSRTLPVSHKIFLSVSLIRFPWWFQVLPHRTAIWPFIFLIRFVCGSAAKCFFGFFLCFTLFFSFIVVSIFTFFFSYYIICPQCCIFCDVVKWRFWLWMIYYQRHLCRVCSLLLE